MIHDPFDGPEWATVIGQVVTALGIIIVAFVANRARRDAKVVRDQVENDHKQTATPNLREDMDAKARAAEARDRAKTKQLASIEEKVDGMAVDMRLLRAGYFANREDIDDLMDTAEQRKHLESWGPPPQSRRERRERRDG